MFREVLLPDTQTGSGRPIASLPGIYARVGEGIAAGPEHHRRHAGEAMQSRACSPTGTRITTPGMAATWAIRDGLRATQRSSRDAPPIST